METFEIGRKGELGVIEILESKGCVIIDDYTETADYDIKALYRKQERTFEVKCQPNALRLYNAFTIEIGDSSPTYYDASINNIKQDINTNKRYYPTGLSVSNSDYYVFTDTQHYIFVPTKKLKTLVRRIYKNEPKRFKFNPNTISSYGVAIRIEELNEICIFCK